MAIKKISSDIYDCGTSLKEAKMQAKLLSELEKDTFSVIWSKENQTFYVERGQPELKEWEILEFVAKEEDFLSMEAKQNMKDISTAFNE